MKQFLLKLFTWLNGQTFVTQLWSLRFGDLVERGGVAPAVFGGRHCRQEVEFALAIDQDRDQHLVGQERPERGGVAVVEPEGVGPDQLERQLLGDHRRHHLEQEPRPLPLHQPGVAAAISSRWATPWAVSRIAWMSSGRSRPARASSCASSRST